MKYLSLDDFFGVLKKFSYTQERLINAFLKLADGNGEWPKNGKITINGETWKFRKHGAGACFTNETTKEEIDPHTGLETIPHKIDDWQLEIYFISIYKAIAPYNKNKFDLHSENGLKNLLTNLRHSNVSIPINYRPTIKN